MYTTNSTKRVEYHKTDDKWARSNFGNTKEYRST